ncbi:DUF6634 family protein [Microvirga tunisiensis]
MQGLEKLLADLKALRAGAIPTEDGMLKDAPVLDYWVRGEFPVTCLVGGVAGHPTLPGKGRPIRTSDLWLLSEDHSCARTLSRWYRLGRPFETVHEETVLS